LETAGRIDAAQISSGKPIQDRVKRHNQGKEACKKEICGVSAKPALRGILHGIW
jgi:hypothetical protein